MKIEMTNASACRLSLRRSLFAVAAIVLPMMELSACATPAEAPLAAPRAILGAVKVRVSDLERAVNFYQQVFGLEQVGTFDLMHPPGSGRRLREAALKPRDPDRPRAETLDIFRDTLILMQRADGTPYEAPDDLANLVIMVPDVDAAARAARALGGAALAPPIEIAPGLRLIFLRDPDGNVVECVEAR